MPNLSWENKRPPIMLALPFQTIETVNESNADRQARVNSLFANSNQNSTSNPYNRLIWGDKKYVLPSLLPEYRGKVNLIYIDPPFMTDSNFSFKRNIPNTNGEKSDIDFTKQPSFIEQRAYYDTWGGGIDTYLQWFYETAIILRELLADNGSIYVHLDWHIGHYAKLVLDEVFGYDNFVNEIVWCYTGPTNQKNNFPRKHDCILFYSKTKNKIFNADAIRVNYKKSNKATGKNALSGKKDDIYLDNLDALGKIPESFWTDIADLGHAHGQSVAYATQKPEALLERVIKASSNEGDLVLDCFCGSGTTAAVAEKLGRRWITCDLGRFAIHTARKRLLSIQGVRPFVLQNLGKYERQQWIAQQVGEENISEQVAMQQDYYRLMLVLYQAQPLQGHYQYLQGIKSGRAVHIGSVDAPVTVEDIKAAIKEFWAMGGEAVSKNGIDFLGWDFAFDINETATQMAAENKVNIRCKRIPRETLQKEAEGSVVFHELASLRVEDNIKQSEISIQLQDFVIPLDDVPKDIQDKINHWEQWIDYWAVDWNYKNDTFHNEWQSYRSRQNPKLELIARHNYEAKGKYKVLIKVIDILGNDTTKCIAIEIK